MNTKLFKHTFIATSLFFLCSFLSNSVAANTPKEIILVDFTLSYFSPDSTEDTIIYQLGDTIEVYISGQDTTYITYAEEIPDSSMYEMWTISDPHKEMIVELSSDASAVNEGLVGVNLTDFFEPNKAPVSKNTNYNGIIPDPWEALVALAPKTVRIFSGASAKFMNPLKPAYDPVTAVWRGGYGYDWTEMVSYFDGTDPEPHDAPSLSTIVTDLLVLNCPGCGAWMAADLVPRFIEFYEKSISQPIFNPLTYTTAETQPLYINQAITLINLIEEENSGLTVDVIYCVNIESMTASEMLEVIDYLRDHGLHVAGVELGNESYFKFGADVLGFEDFAHYYDYISGNNYETFGGSDEDDLLDALRDDMEDDHDFIEAIKMNGDYWDIKIGLPAASTPNCGKAYNFPLAAPDENGHTNVLEGSIPVITEPDPAYAEEDCECNYPQWNIDMATHYADVTTLSTYAHYNFNAIIFHPYYTTTNTSSTCTINSNWRDMMLDLHPDFDAAHLSDILIDDEKIPIPPWDYVNGAGLPSTNGRLKAAFFNIAGIHYPHSTDPLIAGNFKEFVRDRIDISMEEHAYWMHFTASDGGAETKEVWITESNLSDGVVLPSGFYENQNTVRFQNYESTVSNSFAHAVMLQNWFLWNIKANYDIDYRSMFLTTSTIQNFLGGSTTMMMTNSDLPDQIKLGEAANCTVTETSPYFVRRATYYAVELWKVIAENHLKYLKSTTTMASLNNNLSPTVFIDENPADPKIYVFYTNVTAAKQWFGFDPGSVVELFEDPAEYEAVLSTDIDAVILDADQLYSSAGKSTLFKINAAYNSCNVEKSAENRFELTGLESAVPNVTCPTGFITSEPNSVCIELPAVSMGYFIIPIQIVELRKGNSTNQFGLFPNPANTYFIVQQINPNYAVMQLMDVSIYTEDGSHIKSLKLNEGEAFDIALLPVGIYSVVINSADGLFSETERLVKMK